ncbi:hypothetical protein D2917_17065 [Cupriavidus oxalaticus]|uniref:Uncharacterized protein n=1 Tax=Cupriavidus oxalaticus TaxID=96344 RepID=A0A5P3VJ85_9BURK|nr:hypothetical protein D2917_17065 [Cupriavidus oxalaticus]
MGQETGKAAHSVFVWRRLAVRWRAGHADVLWLHAMPLADVGKGKAQGFNVDGQFRQRAGL